MTIYEAVLNGETELEKIMRENRHREAAQAAQDEMVQGVLMATKVLVEQTLNDAMPQIIEEVKKALDE